MFSKHLPVAALSALALFQPVAIASSVTHTVENAAVPRLSQVHGGGFCVLDYLVDTPDAKPAPIYESHLVDAEVIGTVDDITRVQMLLIETSGVRGSAAARALVIIEDGNDAYLGWVDFFDNLTKLGTDECYLPD